MDGSLSVVIPNINFVEYNSPGTYSWTCPPNVFAVYVTGCGGGGGGQSSSYGRNGGVGVYGSKPISVTPGTVYTIIVGTGGSAGTGSFSSSSAGGSGNASLFKQGGTTLALFGGGSGGTDNVLSATAGASVHPGYGANTLGWGGYGSISAQSNGGAGQYGFMNIIWGNASS